MKVVISSTTLIVALLLIPILAIALTNFGSNFQLNDADTEAFRIKETPAVDVPQRAPSLPTSPRNGIRVASIKMLDDRSLAQNLQLIEANLANVRFFDQNSLATAIGGLQGGRMDSSSFSASVTMQPSPSFETATTTDTSATGAISSKVLETEKQGSNSPSSPAAVQPTSVFVPPAAFRLAAQDLLAEQMSMTYEIMNLRTFLQRSLSDRQLDGKYTKTPIVNEKGASETSVDTDFGGARMVAVLGFNISVTNYDDYNDALAEVQIEIANEETEQSDRNGSRFKASYDQAPSLIMQSPVEKSYNVATITKDAKSFSLGAAVQVLNIGVAAERKSETLYLVRDNDTVAVSNDSFSDADFANTDCTGKKEKSVSFGWQFRPVLGRRSVEGGTRKVLAMIALPNSTTLSYTGTVRIRTRWLKFDRKKKVVGREIGTPATQCMGALKIPSLQATRESLKPSFSARWTDIGSGIAEVAITGENFLPGTNVVVGDATYGPSSPNFRQFGEVEIRLTVPIQKLASYSDVFLSSDYGGLQPIQDPQVTEKPKGNFRNAGWGTKITAVAAESDDGQNVKLTIKVRPVVKGARPTINSDIHHGLLIIGDHVFDTLGKESDDPNDAEAKLITLKVPLSLAEAAGKLTLKDIFWGYEYSSGYPLDFSKVFSASKVEILATEEKATWLAVRGSNFADDTKVIVGDIEYTAKDKKNYRRRSSSLIEIRMPMSEAQLKGVKQLIVSKGEVYLPIQMTSAPPKLSIQIERAGAIGEGEVKDIKLEGGNLGNVSYVLFINDRVPFSPAGDGKSGTLSVTRELSRERGHQQLNFILKDGTVASYLLKISSP